MRPFPYSPLRMPPRRAIAFQAACVVGLAPLALPSAARAQTAPSAAAAPAVNDINRDFLDPALDPDAWVAKFEIESREVFAARESILAAVGLRQGDRIADVGSGTGLYLRAFSAAVGAEGRVWAVDISPRLAEFIERRVAEENLENVAVVRSTTDSTRLPPGAATHAFVCDTYHHFVDWPAMLASIRRALVPGGTLVVVDFDRVPGKSREWLLSHVRAGKDTVKDEIVEAGFEFLDEPSIEGFEENYLLRFRRP